MKLEFLKSILYGLLSVQIGLIFAKQAPIDNEAQLSIISEPPTPIRIRAIEATTTTKPVQTAKAPIYYNFAMSCFNDKTITFDCQKDPYRFYCDSNGKLRQQSGGKKDSYYCEFCDCIDLNPKSFCLATYGGQSYCAGNPFRVSGGGKEVAGTEQKGTVDEKHQEGISDAGHGDVQQPEKDKDRDMLVDTAAVMEEH